MTVQIAYARRPLARRNTFAGLTPLGRDEFEGYASLFGVRDGAGDMVAPGAFAASLRRRGPADVRLLYQHFAHSPIGVWDEIAEDGRGLYVRGRLSADVEQARDVRALLAEGALNGLSIGCSLACRQFRRRPAKRRSARASGTRGSGGRQGGLNMVRFAFWETPDEIVARQARHAAFMSEIAAARMRLSAAQLCLLLKNNFNPNQSRIPAGQPGGGRWAGTGRSGSVRVAAADEDEKRPEEEFDPLGEVRDTAFATSYRGIRCLEPNNPKLTFISSGNSASWDTVNAYQKELEAARTRASDKIASGHAFEEHAADFGVSSRADFAAIVRQTISSPLSQVRDLLGERTMYYAASENTVVFVQSVTRDGGSMFKPEEGQAYINKQR